MNLQIGSGSSMNLSRKAGMEGAAPSTTRALPVARAAEQAPAGATPVPGRTASRIQEFSLGVRLWQGVSAASTREYGCIMQKWRWLWMVNFAPSWC